MPLFYQQNINATTRLAIWKIEETEAFFSGTVPIAHSITHPHKRLQHYAGRFLLRYLFPDFPYEEILIADTRKPFLPEEQYHFSISHCGDYAAALVSSTNRVGIDIEIPTQRVYSIAHKFLSEEERLDFTIQATSFTTKQLTLLWSAKEAMFKWWAKGEVDFSQMMYLKKTIISEQGTIDALFIPKEASAIGVEVNYQLFNHLCLAWLMTPEKKLL